MASIACQPRTRRPSPLLELAVLALISDEAGDRQLPVVQLYRDIPIAREGRIVECCCNATPLINIGKPAPFVTEIILLPQCIAKRRPCDSFLLHSSRRVAS